MVELSSRPGIRVAIASITSCRPSRKSCSASPVTNGPKSEITLGNSAAGKEAKPGRGPESTAASSRCTDPTVNDVTAPNDVITSRSDIPVARNAAHTTSAPR